MGCIHGKCFGHFKRCCRCSCSCTFSCFSRCNHCESPSDAAAVDPSGGHGDDAAQRGSGGGGGGGRLSRTLSGASLGSAVVPSASLRLLYSFLSQRGYYPGKLKNVNQDSFCVFTQLQNNPDLHLFGVFDGHGKFGNHCSEFVRNKLAEILDADPLLWEDPVEAYNSAFAAANSALRDSEIDDSMSGTTAVTVLVRGDSLFVANVGDSRAVAGVWDRDHVVAEDLSSDHTPFRRDEYERVRSCGARVLTFDQLEGRKDPAIQSWGDEDSDDGDPPRLWVPDGSYPGAAFTRSVGDAVIESIGVIAAPEVKVVKLTENHRFFVIATDGVFDFLSSQAVVDRVSSFVEPRDACSAIVAESYKLWLDHVIRTDDITIIIVQIKDLFKEKSTGLVAAQDSRNQLLGIHHPSNE